MTSCTVLYFKSAPGTDWQAYFPEHFKYTFTAGGAFTIFYSPLVDFQSTAVKPINSSPTITVYGIGGDCICKRSMARHFFYLNVFLFHFL